MPKKKPRSFVARIRDRVVSEPAVTVGVVVAALNAVTVQTWEGYASAVLIALVRFAVSPAGSFDR